MQVNQAGRRGKIDDLSREVSQTEKSVVTTNYEKSAEVIVPDKGKDRTVQSQMDLRM